MLPADAICFVPPDPVDPVALTASFEAALAELRPQTELDPFSNPILLLAVRINRQLDAGSLSLSALEQVIQRLTALSFQARARRLRAYLGEPGRAANEDRLRQLFRRLMVDPNSGATLPFEAFRDLVGRARFGIVVTAHPTFALARGLQEVLVELALGVDGHGRPLTDSQAQALIERVGQSEHRPDRPLDLAEEHRQSEAALAHLHTSSMRSTGCCSRSPPRSGPSAGSSCRHG